MLLIVKYWYIMIALQGQEEKLLRKLGNKNENSWQKRDKVRGIGLVNREWNF